MNIKILSFVSLLAWGVAVNASQDNSKVLVTMDGKPLITQQQLDQAFDRLSKFYILRSKDPQENKNTFLKIMVQQAIFDKYLHDNKIDISPSYQQELKQEIDNITLAVNLKYFMEQASENEQEKLLGNQSDEKGIIAAVNKYISDKKIDTLPSYQQDLKAKIDSFPIESIQWELNDKYFGKQIPLPSSVSDAEVQEYYDENKEFFFFPFEQMKERLRQSVIELKHKNKVDAEIERLKKEYKIVSSHSIA